MVLDQSTKKCENCTPQKYSTVQYLGPLVYHCVCGVFADIMYSVTVLSLTIFVLSELCVLHLLKYLSQVKSTGIFLHDTTVIHPFPLLFFGGEISVQRDEGQETIAVDKWIVFQAPQRIAELVKVRLSRFDLEQLSGEGGVYCVSGFSILLPYTHLS